MVDCRKKKYKKTCKNKKNKKKKKEVKHTSKSYKKKQTQKKGRVSQTQSLVVHVHPKKTTRRRTTNKPKVNPYQQQMNMRNFGMAQQFLYQSQMNSRPKASVNSYYQEQLNKLNDKLMAQRDRYTELEDFYNQKYGNISKKIGEFKEEIINRRQIPEPKITLKERFSNEDDRLISISKDKLEKLTIPQLKRRAELFKKDRSHGKPSSRAGKSVWVEFNKTF